MTATQANTAQIEYWNERGGPQWVQLQERLDAQLGPLGLVALDKAAAQPGESVLDVGCGCGQTSLALAKQVGPRGSVTGIDISQPMLGRARQRQQEQQLQNLTFIHADAQTYPLEPDSVDLLFSRFGVMFFEDAPTAFGNLRPALRPGGRLCFICWQELQKNDWIRVPLQAAAQHVPLPPPPEPGTPGPFSLAGADRVRGILESAGFRDVNLQPYETDVSLGGATGIAGAIEFLLAIGPVAALLRESDDTTRTRVAEAIRAALAPHIDGNHVNLPSATWIVRASVSP